MVDTEKFENYVGWVIETTVHKVYFDSKEEIEEFMEYGTVNWDNAKMSVNDIEHLEIADHNGTTVWE